MQVRQVAGVVDPRPLEVGRQEGAAVVDRAAEVGRRVDRDVAGQVLVLGAQAVQQPRPHRRPGERRQWPCRCGAGSPPAGGPACRCAGRGGSRACRRAWPVFGYSSETHVPVWPCWRELELRRGQRAAAGADLAVVLLELRLVLAGVHLRHRALHEQEDDPLGLRREVRAACGASGLGACRRSLGVRAARPGPGSRTRRRRLQGLPAGQGMTEHAGAWIEH